MLHDAAVDEGDVDVGGDEWVPPPIWDPSPVDLRERADALRALVAQKRALEAEIALLVDGVRRTGAFLDDGHRSVNAWCRATVLWSDAEAAAAKRLGRFLAEHPDAAKAAAVGSLGTHQLDRLARTYANPRCGSRLAEFLPTLLVHAANMEARDFDVVMDRWVAHADPDGATGTHKEANRGRFCRLTASGAGFTINGQFGAIQGAQLERIHQVYIDAELKADWAAAKEIHGDDTCVAHLARTNAQRSADAFLRMALDGVMAATSGQDPGFTVNVVVADTVLDAVEERATRNRFAMPEGDPMTWRCETQDGVIIDPHELLTAAIVGHVRRLVVDSAGVIVDVGRRRRTFTGAMRDAVLLMATRCNWAGCNVPSSKCQVDHDQPWRDGGQTRTIDGRPRCGHHNRARNLGWTIVQDHVGYWRTTRPDGTRIN